MSSSISSSDSESYVYEYRGSPFPGVDDSSKDYPAFCVALQKFAKLLKGNGNEEPVLPVRFEDGICASRYRSYLDKLVKDLNELADRDRATVGVEDRIVGFLDPSRSLHSTTRYWYLYRLYNLRTESGSEPYYLDQYLEAVVKFVVQEVQHWTGLDLSKYRQAVEGAKHWHSLHYLAKSMAVLNVIELNRHMTSRPRLHLLLCQAHSVVQHFTPGGEYDQHLNATLERLKAKNMPLAAGWYGRCVAQQHTLVRAAQTTFERLERETVDYSRDIVFTTQQRALEWCGLPHFQSFAFPSPADPTLRDLQSFVMKDHLLTQSTRRTGQDAASARSDAANPVERAKKHGLLQRKPLLTFVNRTRPTDEHIDGASWNKVRLSDWIRLIYEADARIHPGHAHDKAFISQIHGILKNHKPIDPSEIAKLQHVAYGDGQDATRTIVVALKDVFPSGEAQQAEAAEGWRSLSAANRLWTVLKSLEVRRLAVELSSLPARSSAHSSLAASLSKSPMISTRRGRFYGITDADLEHRWGALAL